MEAPTINTSFKPLNKHNFQRHSPLSSAISGEKGHQFAVDLIAEFIDGILLFTDQKQLIYANDGARKILSQLHQGTSSNSLIPEEIWHICQSLIQSRHLFPDQNWLIEFDIFTHDAATLHIRARWLKLDSIGHPCLLLTIEDRQQAIVDIVMEEAEKYGLTPREKEVWLLHRHNSTYKQIAAELGITPNTVKKHMRSIYAKQKALLEPELEA